MNRRQVLTTGLQAGAALGLGPLVLSLARCGAGGGGADASADSSDGSPEGLHDAAVAESEARADSDTEASPGPHDVLLGLYRPADAADEQAAVRDVLDRLDASWLVPGDSVLVKITSNSGNPHPAVTSPAAVAAVVAWLKEKGAGRVVVGEQAGAEQVRQLADGRRYGSTRATLAKNGLLDAIEGAGAEAHFFDDQPWETGFYALDLPAGHHWPQAPHVPAVLQQVDHLVVLPRLSSHLVAGASLGHKVAVGWLRDDSRFLLHNDGAFFYERFAELCHAPDLAGRLRLVLTFAPKALLDMGPDAGTVYDLDPWLVLASSGLIAHDVVATGLLRHLDAVVPKGAQATIPYTAARADALNRALVTSFIPQASGLPWTAEGAGPYTKLEGQDPASTLSGDRVLARAFDLTGGRPDAIRVTTLGAPLDPVVQAALEAFGEGVARFS